MKLITLILSLCFTHLLFATGELIMWSEQNSYNGYVGDTLILQCGFIGGDISMPTTFALLKKVSEGTYSDKPSTFKEVKTVREGSYGEVYWASSGLTLEDSGQYICVVTQSPDYYLPGKHNSGSEEGQISTAFANFSVHVYPKYDANIVSEPNTFEAKTDKKHYIVACWTLLMVDCNYIGGDPTSNLYATLLKEVSPGEFSLQNTTFSDPHIYRQPGGTGSVSWTSPKITLEDAGRYSCVLILESTTSEDINKRIQTASDTFQIIVHDNGQC